jgi:hypothetical protein
VSARLLIVTASWALLRTLAVAADDVAPDPAIPPGEEAVIAAMLGKGGALQSCVLTSGGVEYSVIKATYACPGSAVSVRLDHPRNAAPTSMLTGQFAITVDGGAPPAGFVNALASAVRAQERSFEWGWADPEPAPDPDDGAE